MTFADAKQILDESPTAATAYFKGTTTDKWSAISSRFRLQEGPD
jgi:hypothetical protein